MQRILEPHQIEALDHNTIPRVRLPQRTEVFSARAQRLHQLAGGHPIGGYLRLLAGLVTAQHDTLQSLEAPLPADEFMRHAQAHCMPLVPAAGGHRDGTWRTALTALLSSLRSQSALPAPVTGLLVRLDAMPPDALDAQADALLMGHDAEVDPAAAPFLMAALQVAWTAQASRLAEKDVPMLDVHGVCPVCGTLPVASVVRIGGPYQGFRYLHCALCASEWHMVRIKCTHCEATEGIAYHVIEGGNEAIKAESCDECHTYRKIFYQEKDPLVEPVADDLGSLALDLLMSDTGYARSSGNPLLWQSTEA